MKPWNPEKYNNEYYNAILSDDLQARISAVARHLKPEWHIFDGGGGNGRVTGKLAKYVKRIDSIDFSAEAVAMAKKENNPKNVNYSVASILDVQGQEDYDCVTCLDVIEHIEYANHPNLIQNLRSFLKPGGTLIMSTSPLLDNITNKVLRWRAGGIPVAPGDWYQMSEKSFKKLLKENGFGIRSIEYVSTYLWTPFKMIRSGDTILNKLPLIRKYFGSTITIVGEKI